MSNPTTEANTAATPAGTAIQARDRAKTPTETQGIRLTELAAKYVRQYMDKTDNPATQYLYLGVKGGGCSGLSYVLDLRDERHAPIAETDELFLSQDLVVVSDLKSFMVGNLDGTTIDYEEGLMGAGFTFKNPNAKHSCGCGSSYST
jgi:iron-sulfur cluster assembly protein